MSYNDLPKEFEEKMKTLLGSEYEEYTACYDGAKALWSALSIQPRFLLKIF